MIFLTLMLVGALAGVAVAAIGRHRIDAGDAAMRGAGGAFFAGGVAVGLAPDPVGALEPLPLGAGIAGAVALELALRRLERPAAPRRS